MLPPVPKQIVGVWAQSGAGGQKQRPLGDCAEGEPVSGTFLGEDGGGHLYGIVFIITSLNPAGRIRGRRAYARDDPVRRAPPLAR